MQLITATKIDCLVLDNGEGWLTIFWLDNDHSKRSLTIDFDGFCQREMPIRSGLGVELIACQRDRVHLRFTDQLATNLQLATDVCFAAELPKRDYENLLAFAECLP